ncbi:MAG: SpoIIIAH-like family protein [Oscillospiraceae bacterium]
MKRLKLSNHGKRIAVLTAVLLMVCAAVYLNWRYTDQLLPTTGKILGKSTLVSAEDGGSEAEEAATGDYFATARLTRQQARDSALALLEQAAAEEGADQDVLNEASAGIQVLAAYTMAEAQIENLVTAKGYADCVAFMSGESISVVVASGEEPLTATDVAKITDIVINETGYTANQITILESDK